MVPNGPTAAPHRFPSMPDSGMMATVDSASSIMPPPSRAMVPSCSARMPTSPQLLHAHSFAGQPFAGQHMSTAPANMFVALPNPMAPRPMAPPDFMTPPNSMTPSSMAPPNLVGPISSIPSQSSHSGVEYSPKQNCVIKPSFISLVTSSIKTDSVSPPHSPTEMLHVSVASDQQSSSSTYTFPSPACSASPESISLFIDNFESYQLQLMCLPFVTVSQSMLVS